MKNLYDLRPNIILILIVLIYASCGEDACIDTVCLNNGTTLEVNGDCQCDCDATLYIGEQCDIPDPSKVQQLLDAGSTPLALYNDGVPVDSFYGKVYQGGLIFYLNTDTGSGLVAASENQGLDVSWGCLDIVIEGADGRAIGTGQQNTLDIVEGCDEPETAAMLCQDFVVDTNEDWFLPSRDELGLIYENLYLNNHGDFISTRYWSSTEAPGFGLAWCKDFIIGIDLQNSKESTGSFLGVRAVRAF